jgi:GNAT superfamily N-acetyltransferase
MYSWAAIPRCHTTAKTYDLWGSLLKEVRVLEPTFTPANPVTQRDALLAINVEYASWAATEMEAYFGINVQASIGMTVAEYVSSVLDTICGDPPPRGIFYLVELDHQLAGMGGIRYNRPGVAEIKRLYVRPAYRGAKLGATILQRLLADARTFGYERVQLDTGPFMHAALKLYEAAGFKGRVTYGDINAMAVGTRCCGAL